MATASSGESIDESAAGEGSPPPAVAVRTLPSAEREGQIFWRLRYRIAKGHLRKLLAESRLRTALVAGLSVFFWASLFALFYGGFEFVIERVEAPGAPYHAEVMRFVFSLFFLSLQVMLIFSSGIILYSGLYASRETAYLLTIPVRDERIVSYRFQESVLFSSWGFFLLASPMLLAYGMVAQAPWYYFAYMIPLMASFAYIPCCLGAILCVVLIHRLPRWRRVVVGVVAIVVIGISYDAIWHSLEISTADLVGTEWFKETFHRFRFTREEWLPSTWLSHSLIEAARSSHDNPQDLPWLLAGKYLVVLLSNALLLHLIVEWSGARLFRDSYCALHSRRAKKPLLTLAWLDRLVDLLLRPFPAHVRLLIVKDLRLFRRDPVQWSQFLIFFGLLLLYFANVDRFRQHKGDVNVLTWVNVVSFLNLAVVGLILSTFTTRFIYPLLSLEGRRFWILSLLPVERDSILWSKFLFASIGSWLPSAALILVSDLMLNVDRLVVAVHQGVCVLLCLGLSGMAVGFGAIMPDFREQSPSKIAAGFGGTLNLVLSAAFIMAVVLMTALPCHFYLLAVAGRSEMSPRMLQPAYLRTWLWIGVTASLALSAAVTILPLRSGLRAFRKLEV
jgi:ABC-2 type transport system permease protein